MEIFKFDWCIVGAMHEAKQTAPEAAPIINALAAEMSARLTKELNTLNDAQAMRETTDVALALVKWLDALTEADTEPETTNE